MIPANICVHIDINLAKSFESELTTLIHKHCFLLNPCQVLLLKKTLLLDV